MSLSGVMRRTVASRIAIRASTVTRRHFHQTSTTTPTLFTCSASCNCSKCACSISCNCSRCAQRAFTSFSRNFSTTNAVRKADSSALSVKSDQSLLRVIESEIECAKESNVADDDHEDESIPEGFPFEIEDKPGQQTITLTRDYHGETITVEVHMPDVITGEEGENDDDDDEAGGQKSSLPIVVRVSKKTGPALEFGCSAYPDEIAIDSLSVKDPENSEDQIAYEGPDFLDLDENLQKAFHKYLEIRGIKPSTTNFLHGFMVEKDAREYITWLENLQKFVKA